jgi:hypothetical protein
MPATARKDVFVPEEVGTYHLTSRIVSRRFLMGEDELTGRDFSHRKGWVEIRAKQLAQVFMIDLLGYAIMDNHLHNTLRNRPDLAKQLSDREVVRRSLMIHPAWMPETEELEEPPKEMIDKLVKDKAYVEQSRERLSDISWYMKCLKEVISRRANAEEGVSGCFWEGRFKMSRMLDSMAVLLCSLYVDLNEVRAQKAATPEASHNSSIGKRIEVFVATYGDETEAKLRQPVNAEPEQREPEPAPAWLSPVYEGAPNSTASVTLTEESPAVGQARASNSGFLSCTLAQYINLCDFTGRLFRPDKRGQIAADLPEIGVRLMQNAETLKKVLSNFQRLFPRACGSPKEMEEEAAKRGLRSLRGISLARKVMGIARPITPAVS